MVVVSGVGFLVRDFLEKGERSGWWMGIGRGGYGRNWGKYFGFPVFLISPWSFSFSFSPLLRILVFLLFLLGRASASSEYWCWCSDTKQLLTKTKRIRTRFFLYPTICSNAKAFPFLHWIDNPSLGLITRLIPLSFLCFPSFFFLSGFFFCFVTLSKYYSFSNQRLPQT